MPIPVKTRTYPKGALTEMTTKTPALFAAGLTAATLLLSACSPSGETNAEPLSDISVTTSDTVGTQTPEPTGTAAGDAGLSTLNTETNEPAIEVETAIGVVNTLNDSPLDKSAITPITVRLRDSVRLDIPAISGRDGITVLTDDKEIVTFDFDSSDPTAGYVTVIGHKEGVTRMGIAPTGPGKNAEATGAYTVYEITVTP